MTPFEISVRVFLQIAVILAACRLVGRLVRPFGQPQVVAEMITGVLLGPSLLGLVAPAAQAWLFPPATKPVIYVLAQIGLAVGSVVSPEVGRYGGLAQAGLGLLFLKYGRDDEREADSLGLRYLLAGGYEPNEMPKMFTTLRRVSEAAGAGRIPAWMSTHPDPDARGQRIRDTIAARL